MTADNNYTNLHTISYIDNSFLFLYHYVWEGDEIGRFCENI